MNILEVITVPFFEPRGTAFSSLHRTQALSFLGHRIDIAAYPLGKDITIPRTVIHRAWRLPGIHSITMGASIKKLILEIFLAIKVFLMLIRKKYDIMHVHEESVFYGVLYKMIFGVKLIYDMHSSIPEQFANFNTYNIALIVRIVRGIERFALHHCDQVIVISPFLKQYVNTVAPAVPVTLIENIPLPEMRQPVDEQTKKEIISNLGLVNKKVILYTGTLGYNQGVDLLISGIPDIVRTMPEAVCLIVGGEEKDINTMRQKVRGLSLDGHVIFTGKITHDTIAGYVAIADILVSPRRKGNNPPLKLYSYLISGKPLVATDLQVHTQVLNSETALLVEATSQGIAGGIISLLRDPRKAQQIAQRALEYANEHFTEEKYRDLVASVYKRIYVRNMRDF